MGITKSLPTRELNVISCFGENIKKCISNWKYKFISVIGIRCSDIRGGAIRYDRQSF